MPEVDPRILQEAQGVSTYMWLWVIGVLSTVVLAVVSALVLLWRQNQKLWSARVADLLVVTAALEAIRKESERVWRALVVRPCLRNLPPNGG